MDSPQQKWLREDIAAEFEALFKKHDIGGYVVLVSKGAVAWRVVHPDWTGISREDDGEQQGLRVRLRSAEGEGKADLTVHFLDAVRQITGRLFMQYSTLWDHLMAQFKADGVEVDFTPFHERDGVGIPPKDKP